MKHLELPEFGEKDIKIIYRDRIKVFFKSSKNAEAANYTEMKAMDKSSKKKDGCLYSFTGLRGDAKQLYFDIYEGKEKRICLIKAPTIEE